MCANPHFEILINPSDLMILVSAIKKNNNTAFILLSKK